MKDYASWSILATKGHDIISINQLDKSTFGPFNAVVVSSSLTRPTIKIQELRLASAGLCFLWGNAGVTTEGALPFGHRVSSL